MSGIKTDAGGAVTALVSRDAATGAEERHEADAVVFAISISGEVAGGGLFHRPVRTCSCRCCVQ